MYLDEKHIGISFTLNKKQRLKSRKLIDTLFREGLQSSAYPLKVLFMTTPEPVTLQAGFTVGSRYFRKAVDRNRLKRLMRESYRTSKPELEQKVRNRAQNLVMFFIFTGKEMVEFDLVSTKMKHLLGQITNFVDKQAG